MKFDIQRFTRELHRVYQDSNCLYSEEYALKIFKHYFTLYEWTTGKAHSRIREKTLVNILDQIGKVRFDNGYVYVCGGDEVIEMITDYFRDARKADYKIYHFLAGKNPLYRAFSIHRGVA